MTQTNTTSLFLHTYSHTFPLARVRVRMYIQKVLLPFEQSEWWQMVRRLLQANAHHVRHIARASLLIVHVKVIFNAVQTLLHV